MTVDMNNSTPEPPLQGNKILSLLALTTPVAMGYIPLGAVFGFLFVQAGGDGWMAILSSLIVYAGAAQYMMIPMLAAGVSTATIALATLIVNSRHVFYGLSLLKKRPTGKWSRWYLVFALSDETYSLLTTLPDSSDRQKMVYVAMLNQAWWILGTAIGVILGAQAKLTISGLDFCLASLFAVMTVEQWRKRTSSAPLWLAILSYAFAYFSAPNHALVIAIALSLTFSVLLQSKITTKQGEQN